MFLAQKFLRFPNIPIVFFYDAWNFEKLQVKNDVISFRYMLEIFFRMEHQYGLWKFSIGPE